MITIVDYGMGNLGSVLNMFKYLGIEAQISGDKKEIEAAPKLLLPGVGAFDKAMQYIAEKDLTDVLNYKALEEKIPILGICLGMQLLTNGSEEGSLPGLGWIPAQTIRFDANGSKDLKVPHMGWNLVSCPNPSPLTESLGDEPRYYFVHSFHVKVDQPEHSILHTSYGVEFDSGIARDNIFGVQFHPEKSHKFGMRLLSNFAKI